MTTRVIAIAALTIAVAVAVAVTVLFPVAWTTLTPSRDFVQKGNVTWGVSYDGTTADEVQSTYRLYQAPYSYLLELDVLPRDLAIPPSTITSAPNVLVKMHNFALPIVPLSSLGWWEYIFPLSQSNVDAIVIDGACFDLTTPTCNLVGWTSASVLGQNAFTFGTENYQGYIYFYLQTLSGGSQDWTNYTIGLSRKLTLSLTSL